MEWITNPIFKELTTPCKRITCGETVCAVAGIIANLYNYLKVMKISAKNKNERILNITNFERI